MPNLSSLTLPQLTDLVNRSFTRNLESLSNIMRSSSIVISEQMGEGRGASKRYAERLHRDEYASKRAEGDNSKKARVQYGREKDMTVYSISLQISITELMRRAGKERDMRDKVTALTTVCPNRLDLDLSHRLTYAWDASYVDKDGETVDVTTGNGLSLINPAHTLTGSAITYSTQILGNPQFSKASLEIAETSFTEETYNNLGEKMAMKPDCIITGDDPQTIHEVRELMQATADVDAVHEGTHNVYQSKYKHTVAPRIATTNTGAVDTTKRAYWFLCCSMASDFYLSVLKEPTLKTPMAGNNGEHFSSENWDFLCSSIYGMAIVTARWIRGSKGDGS